MSPTSNRRASSAWAGWLVAAVLLVVSIWMLFERQFIIDTIQYHQFTPSKQVADITNNLELTDSAELILYASHPVIEGKDSFNQHCERREATSPILGCYGGGKIYVYDVTDERLDGIEDVTIAHELLHAVYERLSTTEKQKLEPLLERAYEQLADDELKKRMGYYEKTEPGERYNELHSIIPTEFVGIGDELEQYYSAYFKDRQAIVKLHSKVDIQFTRLSKEADSLVARINTLARTINSKTSSYNTGVASLNRQVVEFNARANQEGGFSSQQEFDAERAALETERNRLDELRTKIKDDIAQYKVLLGRLDVINAETESLNESIDSVLSDEPEI